MDAKPAGRKKREGFLPKKNVKTKSMVDVYPSESLIAHKGNFETADIRKGREGEGRIGWIWRDGGAGESANIPGGEWPLEMPGWPSPLSGATVAEGTRPDHRMEKQHTWEPKTKPTLSS